MQISWIIFPSLPVPLRCCLSLILFELGSTFQTPVSKQLILDSHLMFSMIALLGAGDLNEEPVPLLKTLILQPGKSRTVALTYELISISQ
jgi:hypothetical protein